MNEEYLVEPTFFKNAQDLKYLLEKFGFHQGRFIVEFPGKWRKLIYEHSENFTDVEKKRINELLNKHKHHLLSGGLNYASEMSWLDNAHQQIIKQICNDIIARDSGTKFGYKTIEEIDENNLLGGREIRIPGKTEEYGKITKRLLERSHEVHFIDPYLKLQSKQRKEVIQHFLQIAQSEGSRCTKFIIWIRQKEAEIKEDYEKMLRREYENYIIKKNFTINVKLLDDDTCPEKMHTRLMLSTLGGIRFDHGIENFPDERMVDVMILDKKIHDDYCRLYVDNPSPMECYVKNKYLPIRSP